jgi:hypothetical protein
MTSWRISVRATISATLLLCCLAFAISVSGADIGGADTDMWFHTACGRYMVEHRQVPATDPFSYTSHQHWDAFEWLYEVVTYLVVARAGLESLLWLRTFLVALNALLMFLLVRSAARGFRYSDVAACAASIFWTQLTRPYLHMRPQLPGYTFYLLFVMLLLSYLRGTCSDRRFLCLTGLMTVVWVNFHGSYLLAPGLLGSALLGELLSRPLERRRVRTLAWALPVVAVAALLNPNGLECALQTFYWLRPNIYTRSITEHLPPDLLHDARPWLQIMFALDLLAIGWTLLRRNWFEACALLGLSKLALFATRHIPILGAFVLVALARQAPVSAPATAAGRSSRSTQLVALAALISAAMLCTITLASLRPHRMIKWDTYPIDATRFATDNPLPSHVFNPFEWGGWFMWYLPQQADFIDGRCLSVFSEDIYKDYLRIATATPEWNDLLARYGCKTVIINKGMGLPLADRLTSAPGWKRVYEDNVAIIYVRDDASTQAWLAAPKRFPDSPYYQDYLAMQALGQHHIEQAEALLAAAVRADPSFGVGYLHLGQVYAMQGHVEDARTQWEMALRADPNLNYAHYLLGVYWREHGDMGRARRELEAELRQNPTNTQARQALDALPRA